MRQKGKEREPASEFLIELREAMGMTQAEFASKVLGRTETSVARYETSHPPRGAMLLKLAEIAFEQGELAKGKAGVGNRFHELRLEFLKLHGIDSEISYRRSLLELNSDSDRKTGMLSAALHGRAEYFLASYFRTILSALRSPNPKIRANAKKGLATMREIAIRLEQNRAVDEIREAFGGALYDED